jgi:uncharacterized protein YycO
MKKHLLLFFIFLILGCEQNFDRKKVQKIENKQKETFNQSVKSADSLNSTSENYSEIQEGDLIFQSSTSNQSKAIQLATNSTFSHCGIIFKNGNEFVVYEAVQPVKKTPLKKWISHGKNKMFALKRLKNSDQILTKVNIEKMKNVANKFIGKNYDVTFEWSDDKIYCSELIWKVYDRAIGIQVGKLQKLSEFDLSSQLVKQKMKERYGNNIPLDELVISPGAIYDSPELVAVEIKKATPK